jgi:hypothetical protein
VRVSQEGRLVTTRAGSQIGQCTGDIRLDDHVIGLRKASFLEVRMKSIVDGLEAPPGGQPAELLLEQ